MKPETSYSLVVDWFKRSSAKADQLGRHESAQLWRDGLQHLESMHEQRAELLAALQQALIELREYEFDASGETYNNQQINAALSKATS